MKHLLYLLPLIFLFAACTPTTPPPDTAEFGPRQPLRTITVTGQIQDYQPATDSRAVTLNWQPWHVPTSPGVSTFLDDSGSFRLALKNNVVQDYLLMYDDVRYELVLLPGDTVQLVLQKDEKEADWKLTAPENDFVNKSIELFQQILPDNYWRSSKDKPKANSVEGLKADILAEEKILRARLDKLAIWQEDLPPHLRAVGAQFIDYRLKRNLIFKLGRLLQPHSPLEEDRVAQLAFFPGHTEMPELPAYNGNQIDYYGVAFDGILRASNGQGPMSPQERFAFVDRLIKERYSGLWADMLLAQYLTLAFSHPVEPLALQSEMEDFIAQSPYPMLTSPMQEALDKLTGQSTPQNEFAQKMLSIPSDLENPIPEILEQHRDKVVVIDFWATWCQPCLKEMVSAYPELIADYADEEVSFVFLAKKSNEKIWRTKVADLQFPAEHYLLSDRQAEVCDQLFSIGGIPHTVIFDRKGNLVHNNTYRPGDGMDAALTLLLR